MPYGMPLAAVRAVVPLLPWRLAHRRQCDAHQPARRLEASARARLPLPLPRLLLLSLPLLLLLPVLLGRARAAVSQRMQRHALLLHRHAVARLATEPH